MLLNKHLLFSTVFFLILIVTPFCFLYYKTYEHTSVLGAHDTHVPSSLFANKVLKPKKLELMPYQEYTQGSESTVFYTSGYRQLVLEGESKENQGEFDLSYWDNATWNEEGNLVLNPAASEYVQKVFIVKAKYYKLTTPTTHSTFKGSAQVELY